MSMHAISNRVLNLFLVAVMIGSQLAAGTLPARAAGEGGPWCVGAMQALYGTGTDFSAKAARLLALQQQRSPLPATAGRQVFVSSSGAASGNGSSARPFRHLQIALNRALPGDRIVVAPGEYAPVVMRRSGTQDAPITIAGQTDGKAQAMIDGTGKKRRGLIEIRGASHVTVSGFRLQNAPRDGIFVEGTDRGERNIRILNNDIDTTGNSAIYVGGIVMRFITKVDEYRLFDVLIEGNRVTNTNVPNGVNEAISLGGGVDGFTIRNNHVFDTRQYGIDVKAGAINGSITDNVIHGIERHGIYVDTGSRTIANVEIRRNAVFAARNGIVLARESDRDPENPNLFDIDVADNLLFDIEAFGVMAYRHKRDSGLGRFDDIRIDSNCFCDVRRDAIRLGGIGDFATNFRVEDNMIQSSGGDVWNEIGAAISNSRSLQPSLACPS